MKKAKSTSQTLCKSSSMKEYFFHLRRLLSPTRNVQSPSAIPDGQEDSSYSVIISNRFQVEVMLCLPELVENIPSADEKSTSLSAIELLVDVYSVLTTLEGDSSTASAVIPNLLPLEEHIWTHEQCKTKIGKIIKTEFKNRVSGITTNTDCLVLTLIDPRFAHHRSAVGKTNWDEVEKAFIGIHEQKSDTGKQPDALSNSSKQKLSPLVILLNDKDDDDTTSSSLKEELQKYKSFVTLSNRPDVFSNPLHFWRLNSSNFPLLSTVARELLAVPSSSAATERCFSRASYIYSNPRRSRLDSTTLNALLQTTRIRKYLQTGMGILKKIIRTTRLMKLSKKTLRLKGNNVQGMNLAGLHTLREMPFSCFRNDGDVVFQNLRDGGVSGKLMGMLIKSEPKIEEEDEDDLR